MKLLIYILNIT